MKMGVIGATLWLTSCHAGCHATGHHAAGGIHGMGLEMAPGERAHEQVAAQHVSQMTPVDVAVGHRVVAFTEATA